VDQTGLLHILWLIQHHHDTELGHGLSHVSKPTDHELRRAGLVKVRLSDGEMTNTRFLCSPVSGWEVEEQIENDQLECDDGTATLMLTNGKGAFIIFNFDSYFLGRGNLEHQYHSKAICLSANFVPIIVHLFLLAIWSSSHAEHKISFSANLQGSVSSLTSAVATAVGTVRVSKHIKY
jgi:hypothetical protein